MSGFIKFLLIAVVGVLLGSWGAAYMALPPANPDPHYKGPILSAASDRILRASCFDCHSNETNYPQYTYAPGATQWVVRDVVKGRKALNFSEWNTLPAKVKAAKLKRMREEVDDGDMPPLVYSLAHADAKLSDRAKQRLLADVKAALAAGQ
jgi:hypothetical protein